MLARVPDRQERFPAQLLSVSMGLKISERCIQFKEKGGICRFS
jgi:hypothetical protein